MKFSEVEQVMKDRFPDLTNVDISRILRQAFPAVVTECSTIAIGVRRHSSSALSPFSQSSLVSPPNQSQTITHPLQLENARLLARIHQIEEENQHLESLIREDTVHPSTLEQEVPRLTSSPVLFMVQTTWKGLRISHWIQCFLRLRHRLPTCSLFLTD